MFWKFWIFFYFFLHLWKIKSYKLSHPSTNKIWTHHLSYKISYAASSKLPLIRIKEKQDGLRWNQWIDQCKKLNWWLCKITSFLSISFSSFVFSILLILSLTVLRGDVKKFRIENANADKMWILDNYQNRLRWS